MESGTVPRLGGPDRESLRYAVAPVNLCGPGRIGILGRDKARLTGNHYGTIMVA